MEAFHHCYLYSTYIDTKSNHLADDLSRNNSSSFLSKVPIVDLHPTPNLPSTTGAVTGSTSRLDLTTLDPSVQHYFQHGLAPSTQRTYNTAMKCFHTFCVTYNVLNPFPLTEYLLCCFAAYLADQTLAPQTIKSYLSTLRNMQISLGLLDLREQSSLPILKRDQVGISRARILKGSSPRNWLPITAHILEQI